MPRDLGLIAPNVVTADGQGRAMLELARAAVAEGWTVTAYTDRLEPDLQDVVRWRHVRGAGLSQFLYDAMFWRGAAGACAGASHDILCVMGPCTRPTAPYVYYAQFSWLGWRGSWTEGNKPGAYHRAHAHFSARLERRVLAGARAALAVSDPVSADLRRAGAAGPVSVVPNGIDIDEFALVSPAERADARARLGVRDDEFVVGFVGEFHTTRKGLGPLLQAAARGDERVLVAGEGSVARYRGDRVSFLGKVVPVRPVFAAADVVAVPSLYEPFSLVALEAAAAGIPLVLSTKAGAAEHLRDAAILLHEPTDPLQIRAALDAARSDPAAATARAGRAREVAESLEWRRTAAQALAVLERASALVKDGAR